MSTNGMFRTLLTTQIVEAYDKDQRLELTSDPVVVHGVQGPNMSRVILDIAEALAPTGERFFCNKCGYHGKQQDHLKPESLTPCHYLGSPGMQTFVIDRWLVITEKGTKLCELLPGHELSERQKEVWGNGKMIPLYRLQK